MTLETPGGPESVCIAGTAAEYAAGGQALYVEWAAGRRLLYISGPHIFLIAARHDGLPAPRPGLKAFCGERSLLLQSNDDLRGMLGRILERVAGALWGLLGLIFLIGCLGVANTLALNVHEQRRELAVLRAVGLRRGQIRKVGLFQGLLMGRAALGPGTLAVLCLAWLLGSPANPAAVQPSAFYSDGGLVLACCAAGLASCILAAIAPAHTALWREPSEMPERS
jgi:hypothetical protein